MSDAVAVAVISALALVITAAVPVIGGMFASLSGRVKAVQQQVANDHVNPDGTPINLRDDLDGKHGENRELLLKVQRDLVWIMRKLSSADDRLDALEETTGVRRTHEHPNRPHTRSAPRHRPQ